MAQMTLRMGSNPSAAKCSVVTTLMTSRRPQLVLIDSAIRMDKMGHVKVKIDLLKHRDSLRTSAHGMAIRHARVGMVTHFVLWHQSHSKHGLTGNGPMPTPCHSLEGAGERGL